MFYFLLHLPHLPVRPHFTPGVSDPSPRQPQSRISVLPVKQGFHLGFHFPWGKGFLSGRTENLACMEPLRIKSGHPFFTQYIRKKQPRKHFMPGYTLLGVLYLFSKPQFLYWGGLGLLWHLRGFCRDWRMLLCWCYDGLDADKEIQWQLR